MLYTNGPPHHLLCSHLVAGQGITKVIGFETSKSPCHVRCPIHCYPSADPEKGCLQQALLTPTLTLSGHISREDFVG
jgi:hypothetical protein